MRLFLPVRAQILVEVKWLLPIEQLFGNAVLMLSAPVTFFHW